MQDPRASGHIFYVGRAFANPPCVLPFSFHVIFFIPSYTRLEQVSEMGHRKTIEHIDTKGNRRIIVSNEPGGLRIDEYDRENDRAPWRFRRNWTRGRDREEVNRLLSSHW